MRTVSKEHLNPEASVEPLQDLIIHQGVEPKIESEVIEDPLFSNTVMLPIDYTVKAIKLSDSQRTALSKLIEEAYHIRGSLLREMEKGANPWKMQHWLINTYTVYNGQSQVVKVVRYLDQNMIHYILEELRNLYDLVKRNCFSDKIYKVMNASQHKYLTLNSYGFSHELIAPDLIRIMGINRPIRLRQSEQYSGLKNILFEKAKIQLINDNFYITFSCKVSSEELHRQRHPISKYAYQQHSTQILNNNYEDFTNQARNYRRRQKRQA